MDPTRLEIEPGIWLDAGHAIWLEEWRTLVVADLHLGYAWAHRAEGQLFPIGVGEDTHERLEKLMKRYPADEVILLGDVVHRALDLPALHDELRVLVERIGEQGRVRLIGGNHDVSLPKTLAQAGIPLEVSRSALVGPHLLVHGDEGSAATAEAQLQALGRGSVILGHEHPAIRLSGGVAAQVKCACFLSGPGIIVLPAFSRWAAGCEVGRQPFLSPYPQLRRVDRATAIVAGKLLPVRLSLP